MSGRRGRKRPNSLPGPAASSTEGKKAKKAKVSHSSHGSVGGVVLALGEGDVGQLGLGEDILERTKPAFVDIPGTIIQICAGGMHTVCLNDKGEIYTFGCNDEGALGRETADEEGSETRPEKVQLNSKIVLVSAGDSHTAGLSDDGKVFVWGTFRDANGTMGLTPTIRTQIAPHQILDNTVIVKIASGNDHLVCLSHEGDLYTLGCAEQGQLGRVAECFSTRGGRKGLELILNPGIVRCRRQHKGRGKIKFSDVWTGQYSTFAKVKDDENIYSWGLNNYFQIGHKDMKNRFVPDLTTAFNEEKTWTKIQGGQHHTIALDGSGNVYTLGRKEYGRLGLGENCEEKSEPTLVPKLQDIKCVDVSCGTAVSYAVAEDGSVYSWGMGSSNQLAHSDGDDVWEPEKMAGKQLQERDVISVSSGGQHTLLLAKAK